MEVWYTSSLRPLRLGEEKTKKGRKKKKETGQKYNVRICYALQGGHKNCWKSMGDVSQCPIAGDPNLFEVTKKACRFPSLIPKWPPV